MLTRPLRSSLTHASGRALVTALALLGSLVLTTGAWIVLFETSIRPGMPEMNLDGNARLLIWVLVPLALVLALAGTTAYAASAKGKRDLACQKAQQEAEAQRQKALEEQARLAQQRHQFALEVRGLGIALDRFRQTRILDALAKAPSPYHSIMPQDPDAYPTARTEKSRQFHKRRGDTWRYALRNFVERWPIPVILVAPARSANPQVTSPLIEDIAGLNMDAGLGITLYTVLETHNTDRAEEVIERLFNWFDMHPEMPAAVVQVTDSVVFRSYHRPKGTPSLVRDGKEVPWLFDANVSLLVTRTDRVDAQIRPYAYEAPYQMHKEDGTGYDNVHIPTIKLWKHYFNKGEGGHQQGVDAWHERLKTFIATQNADEGDPCADAPSWDKSKGFKPNVWVPVRWVKWQLEEYDESPLLGYLHRPVTVKFHNDQGKPLSESAKAKAMVEGWQAAMATLPKDTEGTEIQRVFYDTGPDTKRVIPLSRALSDTNSELDPLDAKTGYNITQRIGNIGTTSPWASIGLALMKSYHAGGASVVADLRHDDSATLVMVRPPSEAQKKANKRQPDPFMVTQLPEVP